jgi:dihydroorotate dehydrogenase
MYSIIRPLFFLLSPERAHYLAMNLLSFGLKIPVVSNIIKQAYKPKNGSQTQLLGIHFPNQVGLAAGFDKDARWLHLLKELGFGFVEVGTVTPLPQSGNPKPRLFRLKKDLALINRMGFNNQGLDAMVGRLRNRPAGLIVGGNIGKNKHTPNENAADDYIKCFRAIYPFVDYIAVNVSSPNTPGLRALQDKAFLGNLFDTLQEIRKNEKEHKPILLKIAPDLSAEAISDIISTIKEHSIDGIIATNTTIDRSGLNTPQKQLDQIGAGGLSGAPLKNRSTEIVRKLRTELGPDFPIMGVGGIFNRQDFIDKINAGANLVQVYTGFVYEGPAIVRNILN